MSITYKYQNEFGHEITQQQLELGLEYYSKIFYNNNIPIKEETYRNGILINTSKYVSTEQEITNELLNNPNATFDLIYYENGFRVHEIRSYKDNVVVSKSIMIYKTKRK